MKKITINKINEVEFLKFVDALKLKANLISRDNNFITYALINEPYDISKDMLAKKVLNQFKKKLPMYPLFIMCGIAFILLTIFLILLIVKRGNFDLLTYFFTLCLPAIILIGISSIYSFKMIKRLSPNKEISYDELIKLINK